MNENKIVIAILVAGLCVSAAIYFGGKHSSQPPSVFVPETIGSQVEVVVSPVVSPASSSSAVVSPTEDVDDLTPIAIAIGKEFGTDPEIYVITKSRQVGTYAIGGVTEKGAQAGGAQWWGVKENGVWKYIYSGQSYPNCSVVASYQIPKELLDSCWNEATNTLKSL